MSILIRQSKKADLAELVNLNEVTSNHLNTPASIERQSAEEYAEQRPPGSEFVAIINDKVAGYIGYHTPTNLTSNNHVLEIHIGVHPDFQRKGVGSELLTYIFLWAKKNGYRKISIRVLASNISAIPFYLSNGFLEQGRLKEEFLIEGKFVDDILMFKKL